MQFLKNIPMFLKIELTLKKPEAPVSAEFSYMGVHISRSRS